MKNQLRDELKAARNKLSDEQIKDLSHQIFLNLKPIIDNINWNKFFVYNSFSSEAKTDEILLYLLNSNKQVFLPRVEQKQMVAVRLTKTAKFKTSKFGIAEPIGEAEDINNFVAIIPCLAVDKFGNRLGYGGGFYDKFLQNKTAVKIAICFDFQQVDQIETSHFDVPMDFVVTEKFAKNFKNNQKYCNFYQKN